MKISKLILLAVITAFFLMSCHHSHDLGLGHGHGKGHPPGKAKGHYKHKK